MKGLYNPRDSHTSLSKQQRTLEKQPRQLPSSSFRVRQRRKPAILNRQCRLDARYEKIRHNGNVISCAVLIATGINPDGKRTILGVICKLSEAELHWRDFLQSLLFPNEPALERLVTALLMEISEEWETNKTYLTMKN